MGLENDKKAIKDDNNPIEKSSKTSLKPQLS